MRIIRQFHHVVEALCGFIAPDMKNVQLAGVSARNGLEILDAFELALDRAFVFEASSVNYFYGAEFAQDIARQPYFAIAAVTDAAEQLMVGNTWRARTDRQQFGGGRAVGKA